MRKFGPGLAGVGHGCEDGEETAKEKKRSACNLPSGERKGGENATTTAQNRQEESGVAEEQGDAANGGAIDWGTGTPVSARFARLEVMLVDHTYCRNRDLVGRVVCLYRHTEEKVYIHDGRGGAIIHQHGGLLPWICSFIVAFEHLSIVWGYRYYPTSPDQPPPTPDYFPCPFNLLLCV